MMGCRSNGMPLRALGDGCVRMNKEAGAPAVAVAVKLATPTPETTASILWSPSAGPRVHCVDVRPSLSVVVFCGFGVPPPMAGTQVTAVFGTPFPSESISRTTNSAGNGVPTAPV
jgi:hypothetical protein